MGGTQYYVSEQFPKEVIQQRRRLGEKTKETRKKGKHAWLAYDTLH